MSLGAPDGLLIIENATVITNNINVQDRVGVATNSPEYNLDVHGTANVGVLFASSITGDGGLLSNIASNLQEITKNGNVTSETVQFINATTSIVASGNIHASHFIGDGSFLSNVINDTELESSVSTLRGEIESNTLALRADLQSNVSTLRSEMESNTLTLRTDLQSNVSILRTEMESNTLALRADLQSNVSTLRSEMESNTLALRADLQSNVSTLRSEMESNTLALRADLQSNVSILRSEMESNTLALRADLQSNVSTLRSEMESNTLALRTDLQSNVSILRTEMESNTLALRADLQSNVTILTSEINNIQNNATTFRGTKTFEDDIIIESNLRVNGELMVANTINMVVSDPIIEIGANNLNTGDLGIIMTRHGNSSNVALFYDESKDIFNIGYTSNSAYQSTIEIYEDERLTLNVHGNVEASYFKGDGSLLRNIGASSFDTTDTVIFYNDTTGIIVQSNAVINGNVTASTFIGDGSNLTNVVNYNELEANLTVIRTEMESNTLALRTDLQSNVSILRTEMESNTLALRTDLQSNVSTLRSEMESNTLALRADLQSNVSILRTEMESNTLALRADLQSNVSILRTEMESNTLALRTDLQSNVSTLRSEMESNTLALRADLQSNVSILRTEMESNTLALRADLQSNVSALRSEMESNTLALRTDLQSNVNILRGEISRANTITFSNVTTGLTVDSNVVVEGNVTASIFLGDGGLLSNIAATLQEVSDNGNTTTNTLQFLNAHTAFTTDLSSNVGVNLGQLSNVVITSPQTDHLLTYDGANWINDYNIHNFIKVHNTTGETLYKGNVVYIVDSFNNNVANVALAKSDSASTMPAIGLIHEDIPDGQEGSAVAYGKVDGIDTDGYTEGETVYVSNTSAGNLMNTKPYGLGDQIQNVGICIRQHANNGVVFVTGVGRSNDIPNAPISSSPNYVYVNETNNDMKKIAPENLLTKLQTLEQVVNTGNTVANVISATGFTATQNVSIGGLTQNYIPIVGADNYLIDSAIRKDNGNIIISADTEITGDLIVTGNSYVVSSNSVVIEDRILGLANNNPSHDFDTGIIMEHPGHNVALIHHGDEDRFSMGYTQNTVTDSHVLPDSNVFFLNILGNVEVQNNLVVNERVGISNLLPQHDLSVGSNLYVDDDGQDVLVVNGNVKATQFIGDGSTLENIQSSNVTDFASNVTRISNLEIDLDSNVIKITNLRTDLDSNATRIDNLITDLDSNVTKITDIRTDLDSNATRIDNLITDLDSNVTKITNLRIDLDSNATRIDNLITNLDSNVTKITNLRTDLDSNVTKITNLRTDLDSNAIRIDNLITDLDSNVTKITNLRTDLDSNATRIDNIITDLDSNVTKITNLRTDLDSNVTKITNLRTDLDSNATRIDNIITDLDSNVTKITNLRTDLDSNATRIDNIITDLDSNVTKITNLRTDLDSNATRIDNIITNLDSNVTKITNLRTDLDSNATRITSIESGDMTISGVKTFSQEVIFQSNIHVQGELMVANTVNMLVSDPIIELGANNLNTGDLGIVMTRHGVSNSNVAVVYDESQDVFRVGYTSNSAYDSIIEMDDTSAITMNVHGNVEATYFKGDGTYLSNVVNNNELETSITTLRGEISSNLALARTDIQSNVTILRSEIESNTLALRTDLQSNVTILRGEIDSNLATARTDLQSNVTILRGEIDSNVEILRGEISRANTITFSNVTTGLIVDSNIEADTLKLTTAMYYNDNLMISKERTNEWSQLAPNIDGPSTASSYFGGISMSSDGTVMAVSAASYGAGLVRIYDLSNGIWTQRGLDLDGEWGGDNFGYSISLSSDGTIIAIGAPYNDGGNTGGYYRIGRVYVYEWVNNAWSQKGLDLVGASNYVEFGASVSLSSDGTMLAVGIPRADINGSDSGEVKVYEWVNGAWSQRGSSIAGDTTSDILGHRVSLSSDGSVLAIGALGNSGHFEVYEWDNGITDWSQRGLDISGYMSSLSLSSDGTVIAIGGRLNDTTNGTDSGDVRVYAWTGSAWTQRGLTLDGDAINIYFGTSVHLSADGTVLAAGATAGAGGNCYVKTYKWNTTVWQQVGSTFIGENASDQFGASVAMSSDGNTLAIGAPGYDANSISNTGRVYTYELPYISKIQTDILEVGTANLYINSNTSNVGIGTNAPAYELDVVGNVHADYFIGDGSFLTGVGINKTVTLDLSNVTTGLNVYSNAIVTGNLTAGYLYGDGSNLTNIVGTVDTTQTLALSNVTTGLTVSSNIEADTLKLTTAMYHSDNLVLSKVLGNNWAQLGQTLIGSAAGNQFGYFVSLSQDGTKMVVSEPYYDGITGNVGGVSVFELNGSTWTQKGLTIEGTSLNQYLGAGGFSQEGVDISNDGNTIIIGDPPGSAYVYEWSDISGWSQKGSTLIPNLTNSGFGASVSISGDGLRVAVGAPDVQGIQIVKVYEWDTNASDWSLMNATINSYATGDSFGFSVSLSNDGTRIAIGAPLRDQFGTDRGQVRVFEWTGSSWSQIGPDINGKASYDQFGWSVKISSDGSVVAIGTPIPNSETGYVQVYEYANNTWTQKGLDLDGESTGDRYGYCVDISGDGNRLVVGGYQNDVGGTKSNAGHVRVFDWDGNNWTQKGVDIDGEVANDLAGFASISLDGSRIAIGAKGYDGIIGGTQQNATGQVKVYQLPISTKIQTDILEVGTANLYIDSRTSNVGIGTDAPAYELDVVGNVHADYFIGDGSLLTGVATTLNNITEVDSNVGISNTNPQHTLAVGSNLWIEDTGSNVLTVEGNVAANYFIGDGSQLTGVAVSLNNITEVGGSTGISNTNPQYTLAVGSNLWVEDTGSNVLTIDGNLSAHQLTLDSIRIASVYALEYVTMTGNTTSNTIEFTNESTGLVTTANVGIANTHPIHTLDVGSNLWVEDTGSNVLYVNGNIWADHIKSDKLSIGSNLYSSDTDSNVLTVEGNVSAHSIWLGSVEITPSYTLQEVTGVGNVASSTVQFTNSDVGIVSSGGIVVNKDAFACKHYAYSNVSVPTDFANVAMTFASNVFHAKITAQLTHGNEEVSTMTLDVQGGTRDGTTSSLNIATGPGSVFGNTNTKPWNGTVSTTPTQVILEPSATGTTAYGVDLYVEYKSSAPDGKLESISIGNDSVKSFVY